MKRMTLNAAELDKFIILNGAFGFETNTIEQASKHELWSEIVKVINTNKPVLVYDTMSQELYIGNTDSESMMYLQTLYDNQGYALEINYNNTTDKLTITSTENNYLTDANAPKMYRHQLTLTYLNSETETNVRIQFEVYSSNNLNVNSLENLTNLLKPNNNSSFIGFSLDESSQLYSIRYESSIWKVAQILPPPYDYKPVLSVKDVVTEA